MYGPAAAGAKCHVVQGLVQDYGPPQEVSISTGWYQMPGKASGDGGEES